MSLNHGPRTIIKDGLILHLDAANTKSYPGSGTVWKDLSGNGRDGTLINGVGYSTDNGGTLVFDGTDDYVDCGNDNILSPPYLTASVICKQTSFSTRGHIMGRGAGGAGNFYIVLETNRQMKLYVDYGSNWVVGGDFYNFPLNTWTQITVTHDGLVTKIYINGVLEGSSNRVGTLRSWQSNPLLIGGSPSGTTQVATGNISSAQMYSRALTQSEILNNFEILRERYSI
jgi:hypothetical protein